MVYSILFGCWALTSPGFALKGRHRRLLTDPDSPPEYRANGPVRNLDAWYETFGVTEDDALYLPTEERVHVW
ncbi:MAG: hypothetical protein JKX88_05615 [Marinicaulis sp.]|nr:hypothetical protein [Marinicaulis sp.]